MDDASRSPAADRCPAITVDDILDMDSRPVPREVREDSWRDLGTDCVTADRYTSAAFFEAEKQRMWPNVWQMAAREDELLQPGDYVGLQQRRPFLPGDPAGRRIGQGVPQCLPAPRPQAAHRKRLGRRAAMPVPRLCVGHRWRAQAHSVRVGFPASQRARHEPARIARRALAGLHLRHRKHHSGILARLHRRGSL